MIMERCTQKVIGSFDEVYAIEKEFDELEAKMGNVPAKRRYWAGYGALPFTEMVWERDWESMAALEAYNDITMKDPEWEKMFPKAAKIFGEAHRELYFGY
jgi:hypothetical protein